jgi:outer membrane receptor for ferrienterochelin and colicin
LLAQLGSVRGIIIRSCKLLTAGEYTYGISDLKNSKYGLLSKIAIFLLLAGIIKHYVELQKATQWEFKGAIQKVRYDDKKNPSVTVNGTEYYLFYTGWDSHIKIRVGDTLIKNKGDLTIKVIRPNRLDSM